MIGGTVIHHDPDRHDHDRHGDDGGGDADLDHTTPKCTARYAALVREDRENAVVLFDDIQTEARKKAKAALQNASSLDTAMAMLDAFNKKACAAAKEMLRKDAQAAAFAFATAA